MGPGDVKPYYESDGITIYHGDMREVLPGLDEYPADAITDSLLPLLCERDEGFVRLKSDFDGAADGPERYRTFHRLLAAVMAEWIGGEVEANGLMRWTEFRDGVRAALLDIRTREGRGRRGRAGRASGGQQPGGHGDQDQSLEPPGRPGS